MTDLHPIVLVIDDEPPLRRFLRTALQASGYQVIKAATAQEGLTQTATRQPAIILLDLGLPDLDELEVMRRLREWASMPIIVLSARGQESDKVAALDAGADDYLAKPFGVGELLARVRVALRHAARTTQELSDPVFTVGELRVDLMRLPKYTWTVLTTLTVLGVLIVAFLPRPITVETAPVTRGAFEQTIDEDGKTRVRQRYTVSAPVAGTLQRLQLKAGDGVTRGMLLATIAPSAPPLLDIRAEHQLTERVGTAEATQRRATAEVARAQAGLQRTRQLADRGLVSRSQREQADLAFTTASRELEAATQAERAAQHDVAVARAALLQLRSETAGAQEAQKRVVQIGRRNAVEAIVETGVAENDQVIIYPSDAVRDGVRVAR